jgi:tRNA threonylcarbamoyl adenosine modification protein YeaZ
LKICLSIETTQQELGLGLYRFSSTGFPERVALYYERPAVKQSDILVPTLRRLLKRAPLKPEDVSLIAVDNGPGSFTGVRVGLAVARTMAQELKCPLIGVSSLEAMAHAAWRSDSRVIVSSLPATSGEFFFSAYRKMKPLLKPKWGGEKELAALRRKFSGSIETSRHPHPDNIAAVAIGKFQKNPAAKDFNFEKVKPMYLQPSWAERSRHSA